MIFDRLNETYLQIESMIAQYGPSPDPAVEWVINEKIAEFAADIHKNGETLRDDLLKHKESLSRLQKMGQIKVKWSSKLAKKVFYACALLEWKVLFKEGNARKLAKWIVRNRNGVKPENGMEFFRELSHTRKLLIENHLLDPETGIALSRLVTFGFGINDEKTFFKISFSSDEEKLEAIAHWVNTEEISLYQLKLSKSRLMKMAPYLHHVDLRYLKSFINLQVFGICVYEQQLTEDDTVAFLKLCTNAYTLLLNNKSMNRLKFLPHQLQRLVCFYCKNLETLDFSQIPHLTELFCVECPFTTLDFSHNFHLESIILLRCPNLTSLGSSLPNTLEQLTCDRCPNLFQLPQMPATASVVIRQSGCGELHSFEVYQTELEIAPKQVLLDLGKVLLQNRPMPNIVYMNPVTKRPTEGLDAGGLRRQLVATLCENLFKKKGEYDVAILDDLTAQRSFARLLGLAATSSMPTGTNFHPSFFHSLFALSDEELEFSTLSEPLLKKLYMARHGLDRFEMSDALEMAEEISTLTAIAISAKELKTLLGPKFRPFAQNIDAFITQVQGSHVTKETLKERIFCRNGTYREWIETFIDKLKEEELKQFTQLLTGSYTLSEGKITFEVFPERKFIETATLIHTCSMTMELPGDLDEKQLHKELAAQLSLLKSFNAV